MSDLAHFRGWLRVQGYAPTTIRGYVSYARRAQMMLGALTRATVDDLERFLASLPGGPSRRAARKALVAYYTSRGARRNPAVDLVVPPEPRRLPRPIPVDAYADYIAAAARLGGAHRVAGWMFAYTGARFSEVRFARRRDFDLGREPSWRVRGKGAARRGPKERIVPLHPALTRALHDWFTATSSSYVLPGERRPCISEHALRALHAEIVAETGYGHAVPHQLRHTVITIALDETRDVNAVREFAGHASLSTLQQYAGLLPGRLRVVADALPPPPAAS